MNKINSTLICSGFELNYYIEGSGIPVIVVGSSIYYPRTFSRNLSSRLQMIYMDHRGFGKSRMPFDYSSFDLNALIDDIELLRKKLQLNQFVIMGHSGHAYIALEYAKKYSEYISHVVLIAASPNGHSYASADQYFTESVCPERKALYESNMQCLKNDIESNPEHRFISYSLRSGPRIWYDYHYDASPLWEDVTILPEMFDYVWGNLFKQLDITQDLEDFNKPVLLMLGRYDYWNPPHLWEPLRSKFNDLTIRIFEKSGHTPQLEEAEYFDSELLNWLHV